MNQNCHKFSIVLLLFIICFTFSCRNGTGGSSKETETIEPPVFSPAAGDYIESHKEISISCGTEGASIFYTTNGDVPNKYSSRYTGPFQILGSTTVRAIAIKDTLQSEITAATYELN